MANEHVLQIAVGVGRGDIVGAAKEAALAVRAYMAKVGEGVTSGTQVVVSIGSAADDDEESTMDRIGFVTDAVGYVPAAEETEYLDDDGLFNLNGELFRKVARMPRRGERVLIVKHPVIGHRVGDVLTATTIDVGADLDVYAGGWYSSTDGSFVVLEPVEKEASHAQDSDESNF
jgi:hypothetical protein